MLFSGGKSSAVHIDSETTSDPRRATGTNYKNSIIMEHIAPGLCSQLRLERSLSANLRMLLLEFHRTSTYTVLFTRKPELRAVTFAHGNLNKRGLLEAGDSEH